jgi:hypothetical protein
MVAPTGYHRRWHKYSALKFVGLRAPPSRGSDSSQSLLWKPRAATPDAFPYSSTDHGPPPPPQPPATNPRPAWWHSRARSASLSSHAWRMASCWAGEIEQPGRIAAQRIPARIAGRISLTTRITSSARCRRDSGKQESDAPWGPPFPSFPVRPNGPRNLRAGAGLSASARPRDGTDRQVHADVSVPPCLCPEHEALIPT